MSSWVASVTTVYLPTSWEILKQTHTGRSFSMRIGEHRSQNWSISCMACRRAAKLLLAMRSRALSPDVVAFSFVGLEIVVVDGGTGAARRIDNAPPTMPERCCEESNNWQMSHSKQQVILRVDDQWGKEQTFLWTSSAPVIFPTRSYRKARQSRRPASLTIYSYSTRLQTSKQVPFRTDIL